GDRRSLAPARLPRGLGARRLCLRTRAAARARGAAGRGADAVVRARAAGPEQRGPARRAHAPLRTHAAPAARPARPAAPRGARRALRDGLASRLSVAAAARGGYPDVFHWLSHMHAPAFPPRRSVLTVHD